MIQIHQTMRKLLTVFAMMTVGQLYAQFDFSTGKEITMNITTPYQMGEVHCVPNPLRDININWELLEMDPNLPSGWNYTICDQICYPFFPSHGNALTYTVDQFNNGEFYELRLGVTTSGINGSGFVKYYIFDANDPSYGDTVVFHLNYQIFFLRKCLHVRVFLIDLQASSYFQISLKLLVVCL